MAIYRIPLAYVLSTTVQAVCFIVAVIMINSRAVGKARTRGLLGLLFLFLSSILGPLNGDVGPWLTAVYGTGVDFFRLGSIVVTGVGGTGVILLVLAAVAAHHAALSRGAR